MSAASQVIMLAAVAAATAEAPPVAAALAGDCSAVAGCVLVVLGQEALWRQHPQVGWCFVFCTMLLAVCWQPADR